MMPKDPIIPIAFTPQTMREHEAKITTTVLVKMDWRVRLGLWLIVLGCWIAGMEYDEENTKQ